MYSYIFIFRMVDFSLKVYGLRERNNHCSINCAVFFFFFALLRAFAVIKVCLWVIITPSTRGSYLLVRLLHAGRYRRSDCLSKWLVNRNLQLKRALNIIPFPLEVWACAPPMALIIFEDFKIGFKIFSRRAARIHFLAKDPFLFSLV